LTRITKRMILGGGDRLTTIVMTVPNPAIFNAMIRGPP
jgi:hypothetical protein